MISISARRIFVAVFAAAFSSAIALTAPGLAEARDVASGLPTGKRQHAPGTAPDGLDKSSPKLLECVAKASEIDALLKSLTQQMDQLQAMCSELDALAAQADEESAASSESAAETLAQLDEAQRVFDEQVASFLDDSVRAQVIEGITLFRDGLRITRSSEGDDVSSSVSPVSETFSSLSEALQAFSSAFSAASTAVSEKHTKSGHVTLLK
jgi:hypothetical protein